MIIKISIGTSTKYSNHWQNQRLKINTTHWISPNLPNKFAAFFQNKIQKSKNTFNSKIYINHTIENVQNLLALFLLPKNQILSIIKNMNPTKCSMNPCNAIFLLQFKNTILDSITHHCKSISYDQNFFGRLEVGFSKTIHQRSEPGPWINKLQTH